MRFCFNVETSVGIEMASKVVGGESGGAGSRASGEEERPWLFSSERLSP